MNFGALFISMLMTLAIFAAGVLIFGTGILLYTAIGLWMLPVEISFLTIWGFIYWRLKKEL